MDKKIRKWVILTALASCVVLVAGWFLLISPKKSQVSGLKAQAASAESANAGLQTKLATLRSQQKGLVAKDAQLAALAKKIPLTADLPGLLRQLSAAATVSNVDLTSLTPSAPQALAAAPGINAVTIALQVQGTYFDTAQYIQALESLSRGLIVTTVTETPSKEATAVGESPALGTGISAIVFTGSLTGTTTSSTATTG